MTAPAVLRHALDPAALRAARLAAGLSLMQTAGQVGCAWSLISRYELGKVNPPASMLAALATVYDVHPGAFFSST